jgi:enamine deaminase RidA (YjgF/YER057c/UK114 family)
VRTGGAWPRGRRSVPGATGLQPVMDFGDEGDQPMGGEARAMPSSVGRAGRAPTVPRAGRHALGGRRPDDAVGRWPGHAMDEPEFFVTPGYGERHLRLFHYSQAVGIGNRLGTAGQGGRTDAWEFPASLADEIAQAFRNVERTLAAAGAGWAHVVRVHSDHVGLDAGTDRAMAERFRHPMPDRAPVWTCLGVAALGEPMMRVEIRVTAILPERSETSGG